MMSVQDSTFVRSSVRTFGALGMFSLQRAGINAQLVSSAKSMAFLTALG